jgi:hypothetical protein
MDHGQLTSDSLPYAESGFELKKRRDVPVIPLSILELSVLQIF